MINFNVVVAFIAEYKKNKLFRSSNYIINLKYIKIEIDIS